MTKPYENIRVLDLTHVLAGPFCTYQFALLGAEVIKIESPTAPDCARGRGPDPAQNAALRGLNYQVQASNKKSMTLDLKKPKGQSVLRELVKSADVLVENYRTGALDALGLGYDSLKALNSRLVYCSLTGYGDNGPRLGVNAYDNVIQATSGIIEQSAGNKPGLSFVDYAAGYNAAFAIASALHQRTLTGIGTYISSSMFEVAMTLMAPEAAAASYPVKTRRGREAGIDAYETANEILMVGAFTPDQNRRMWVMFEDAGYKVDEKLKEPDDWESLWAIADSIRSALKKILQDKTADEWQQVFHSHNLPAERQRTLNEAINDPQLEQYFDKSTGGEGDTHLPEMPVAAYHFEDGPEIVSPAPGFGVHTDKILTELGLSQAEIDDLRKQGVIL